MKTYRPLKDFIVWANGFPQNVWISISGTTLTLYGFICVLPREDIAGGPTIFATSDFLRLLSLPVPNESREVIGISVAGFGMMLLLLLAPTGIKKWRDSNAELKMLRRQDWRK